MRSIKDYIARDSQRYAQIQVERIRSAAAQAGHFPNMGRPVPEFPDEPWREVLTGNYRVIYRPDPAEDRVVVLAVVHGMQLLWEPMIR
ncbi:MAG TPA: type II toxin-antitoxin system RelE/ParE family toxin [Thermoanaerobaculia bacterium]|nr:type II toxin-antitoxin system RelE/ParE family toxin [Thermoanaerobaculia bacterium]